MQTRMKRTLIYSFFLLFIMACRTYACSSPQGAYTKDGNLPGNALFKCRAFIEVSAGSPNLYGRSCTITCPSGPYSFDIPSQPRDYFSNMTYSEVQAQYCPGGASVQPSAPDTQPTEPPTEEPAPPTDAPTDAPTEPPLTSILGGRVSYCSMNAGQHYLNLPFNSGANPAQVQQELDSGALKVVISGTTTEGRCKVLAANNMLLCAFPSGSFPAFSSSASNTILNVVHNGTIIDVLPFNNSCEGSQSVNSGGSGGEDTSGSGTTGGSGGSVPACDPHIDLSCPIDCTIPANADLCG